MRLWLCQQEHGIPLSLSFSIWKMGITTAIFFAYGPSGGCEGLMASSEAEGALKSTSPPPPRLPPPERTQAPSQPEPK